MAENWDEVTAIKAIYPEEVELADHKNFKFSLSSNFAFTFDLVGYPDEPPICTFYTQLHRADKKKFRTKFEDFVRSLPRCQPILLELLTWLLEESSNCANEEGESCEDEHLCELKMMVLSIDHMRNAKRYEKTLKTWFGKLNLRGKLLRVESVKYILVVEGETVNLKEYLKLHRTVCIDVNSANKPCKERLVEVLSENAIQKLSFVENFETLEFANLKSMKEALSKFCGEEREFTL